VDKNAASFIPTHVVTEFVFAVASTITISVTHQQSLDALIQPADYAQTIAVEHALCHDIDGKGRLKVQRAIARYFELCTLHRLYSAHIDPSLKPSKRLTASSMPSALPTTRRVAMA